MRGILRWIIALVLTGLGVFLIFGLPFLGYFILFKMPFMGTTFDPAAWAQAGSCAGLSDWR